MLGFSGLDCIMWDQGQDLAIFKVDTKGGNRPVRARYGRLGRESALKRAVIIYAYGDCLAVAFKPEN